MLYVSIPNESPSGNSHKTFKTLSVLQVFALSSSEISLIFFF